MNRAVKAGFVWPPRSMLFVPANRCTILLPKADRSGTDAIIVDLEDALVRGQHQESLEQLASVGWSSIRRPWLLRVSGQLDLLPTEVRTASKLGVFGYLFPKAESPTAIRVMAETVRRYSGGLHHVLIPLIETSRGLLRAPEIASAAERIVALAFGSQDFCADLYPMGAPRDADLGHARAQIALAAAAGRLFALDSPSTELSDESAIKVASHQALVIGFVGKLAIHPDQIPAINQAFTPDPVAVHEAREIVAAFRAAQADGIGVTKLNGRMIDAPVAAAASNMLARADAIEAAG